MCSELNGERKKGQSGKTIWEEHCGCALLARDNRSHPLINDGDSFKGPISWEGVGVVKKDNQGVVIPHLADPHPINLSPEVILDERLHSVTSLLSRLECNRHVPLL